MFHAARLKNHIVTPGGVIAYEVDRESAVGVDTGLILAGRAEELGILNWYGGVKNP